MQLSIDFFDISKINHRCFIKIKKIFCPSLVGSCALLVMPLYYGNYLCSDTRSELFLHGVYRSSNAPLRHNENSKRRKRRHSVLFTKLITKHLHNTYILHLNTSILFKTKKFTSVVICPIFLISVTIAVKIFLTAVARYSECIAIHNSGADLR